MSFPQKSPQSNSDVLDNELELARERFVENRPESAAAFDLSTKYMPGGNTRTVLFHTPFPLRIVSGDGCRIMDADGIEYVNMLGEYTAGLFGHNHPVIRRAVDKALDRGVNLSGHNSDEIKLSELVCTRFPSIDKVRFTNSGTEANLLAISTARHVTGRKKVMVFEGGYHGGLLYFRSGGMPLNAPFDYLLAKYNDIESTRAMIDRFGSEIACVLIEPMQGGGGCIPASREFLEMLRESCNRIGAILIFDEVMTSRLSSSGAQGLFNIIPDMTTLGKYIGGGMSFGAFGGKQGLMDIFDPRQEGSIPHAGTFNNNSLTMAAGVAAMGEVLTDDLLDQLNNRGDILRNALNKIAVDGGTCLRFTGLGSLLGMHTTTVPISSTDDLSGCDDRVMELVFLDLLEQGYYIARRGFIALMLPVGENEISGFTNAFSRVVDNRGELLWQATADA
jgi:glutamate-1-semialdehyde 2,1-aminomutase